MTKGIFVCMCVRVWACLNILTVTQQRIKTGAPNFSSSFWIITECAVSSLIQVGIGDLSQAMWFLSYGMWGQNLHQAK
jgi:hypothetical protein